MEDPAHAARVFGYYANTPVFGQDGTIYLQGWPPTCSPSTARPEKRSGGFAGGGARSLKSLPIGEGPNGVALVSRTVYGEMPPYAFTLSAATGKLLWRTPELAEKQGQGFNMAPTGAQRPGIYLDLRPAARRVGVRARREDGQGVVEVPGDEEPC